MKHLLMPLLLATLASCGDRADTTTASTEAGAEAAPEAGMGGSKHWVDKSTMDALPPQARSTIGAGTNTPATGPEFVALAEKLSSADASTRISAARAITLTMATAKGDYNEALQAYIGRYLMTNCREFLGLFNGTRNMGKTELAAWAQHVRGSGGNGPDTRTGDILRSMKEQCKDCSPGELEVLDMFVSNATGQAGKGGKGVLK